MKKSKIKNKLMEFEELFQKSKNVLDRLYEREDFKKDMRGYKRLLKIKGPFVKMDALDVRDKNFTKLADERRKKYGSATNITSKEEINWYKSLADKQLKSLGSIGKLLRKKYQKKLNFELPDYVEDFILQYLLYGLKSYAVPLYAPAINLIYDEDNEPTKIEIIKYASTSVKDEQYMKTVENLLKKRLPTFIKARSEKTLKFAKKIHKIETGKIHKKQFGKEYWKDIEEKVNSVTGFNERVNLKTSVALAKINEVLGESDDTSKRRKDRFRKLKSRGKRKLGLK